MSLCAILCQDYVNLLCIVPILVYVLRKHLLDITCVIIKRSVIINSLVSSIWKSLAVLLHFWIQSLFVKPVKKSHFLKCQLWIRKLLTKISSCHSKNNKPAGDGSWDLVTVLALWIHTAFSLCLTPRGAFQHHDLGCLKSTLLLSLQLFKPMAFNPIRSIRTK